MTVIAAARTPTGRKQQLAALLRHLREQSGQTQQDAGIAVWPKASAASGQNKIARLESGNLGIDGDGLRRLLDVYEVDDELVVDLALQLQADTSQRGRWPGCRSVHPEVYRPFIDLEEDAELIRYVTNERIPELLQCPAYARAEFSHGSGSADRVAENTTAATLGRQRSVLFRDNPARFHCVLSESCIRRIQGDALVMREQLTHLSALSRYPHITIQVLPFRPRPGASTVIAEQGILERFVLFRLAAPAVPGNFPAHLDFAYTKTGNELTSDDNVLRYELMWTRATETALAPAQTRDLFGEAAADFGAG
ncbi:helix-turn-helix transcriptional regulator [Amycolatopsis sp.]|uniref:helix-turn-helix domain-containing protein n=1 Tax=Amycolatopsis sp. TaxID=37632 RepID=UPI002B618F76|nr:helix-turn-helix transcriptional regulator [Amycolatopsis sp.]HVV08448.1 helix-turn-helix transcriptional regulator [Amycolatopsis sp.]